MFHNSKGGQFRYRLRGYVELSFIMENVGNLYTDLGVSIKYYHITEASNLVYNRIDPMVIISNDDQSLSNQRPDVSDYCESFQNLSFFQRV